MAQDTAGWDAGALPMRRLPAAGGYSFTALFLYGIEHAACEQLR